MTSTQFQRKKSDPAKGEATRSRVVSAAVKDLSRHGLSGITVGRIAEASGLSKSGMFAHFRSKEALDIALLDEAARLAEETIAIGAAKKSTGLPRLRCMIAQWFGWPARAGLPGGCPMAAAVFELDDAEGPVRDRVAELQDQWRGGLIAEVQAAVDQKQLHASTDVEQLVWELFGIYLAHHTSVRFSRDPNAGMRADIAVEALLVRAGA